MKYTPREITFGTGKPLALIIRFSIPTIIGMLINSLNTFIDRIYVGNIPGDGALSIAGVNVALPITFIIFAFSMLCGMGGGANVSLKLGEGDKDAAERYIGNSLTLGTIFNIFICGLLLLNLEPLFRFFGVSDQVLPYAMKYTSVLLWGNLPFALGFILNRFVLSQGFPKLSMVSNIVSVGINAVLDPVFIFVFGWGVEGAAWATMIAQSSLLVVMLFFYLRKKVPLRVRAKYLRPAWAVVRRTLSLGLSSFIIQLLSATVQMLYTYLFGLWGGSQGDIAVSAFGIVFSIINLLFMPIFGINQGVNPLIGFNYGAGQYSRVKQLLIKSLLVAAGVAVFFWAIMMLFSETITGIFGANQEVLAMSAMALRIIVLVLPVAVIQVIGGAYFQAVGKPIKSIVLSISRQTFFLIPLLFILPNYYGLNGIFYAMPAADLLSSVFTFCFVLAELRRLKKLAATETPFTELLSPEELEIAKTAAALKHI